MCRKSATSSFVATQTIHYSHRERRRAPFTKVDSPYTSNNIRFVWQDYSTTGICKSKAKTEKRYEENFPYLSKKAHPGGCAKKVLSPVAATQTIHHWHGEMRETPFLQGIFPLTNGNIRFVSHCHSTTGICKSKAKTEKRYEENFPYLSKKAHPEGCAEKVFPSVSLPHYTDKYTHKRDKRRTPFTKVVYLL